MNSNSNSNMSILYRLDAIPTSILEDDGKENTHSGVKNSHQRDGNAGRANHILLAVTTQVLLHPLSYYYYYYYYYYYIT